MPTFTDVEDHAPFHFYVEQMRNAIRAFNTGRIANVGFPVMSFFSGKEQTQPSASLNPSHILVFRDDEDMERAIDGEPMLFIKWVETIYFYFLDMAAFPREAKDVWRDCWTLLGKFEKQYPTLAARGQMAAWAASYDPTFAGIGLLYVKRKYVASPKEDALRSLILSSKINDGQDDQIGYVKNAAANLPLLVPVHKLQAIINYYCKVDASHEVLESIISALNLFELAYIRKGKIGLLEPVVWTMQDKNNYNDLLFLLRCFRSAFNNESFKSGHAFVLPNIKNSFTALKVNERIQFSTEGNGDNYARLMRLCNKLNGVAISIRGEMELGSATTTFDDFGKPIQDDVFDELKQGMIDHYHLRNDFFREVNLLTLVPSHNHPVQGALCSLGVAPPLLSTSLQDVVDEADERNYVFFLASSTYTVEIEEHWIRGSFGADADIRIDPNPDDVIAALNDERFTHIYISAHGKFDHWERESDRIHFSETSEVEVEKLMKTNTKWTSRRTVILNLCDGAATRISFNPNNSGLAAALASGSQFVVSHLWPVDPKYAAVFGMFVLDRLQSGRACQDAVLNVYKTLDQDNRAIAKSICAMGKSPKKLARMVLKTQFRFSDFRNIGAVAIYA